MFEVEYPHNIPNLHFIISIILVFSLNYYINTRNTNKKLKYITTGIGIIIMMLIPIPFFAVDRNFGAVAIGIPDFRAYFPFLLLFYIVILFKYYSINIEIIKGKKAPPSLLFSVLFLFLLPHYVFNYGPEGIKDKKAKENKPEVINRLLIYLLSIVITWFIVMLIFAYLPIPWNIIVSCFKGYWAIPLIMGTGFVVINIFIWAASILSLSSCFLNLTTGSKFKYYQDKAFLSTSISEFWRKWNLWGNEWFFNYLYKPLRRKYNFTHSQASLAIFTFSALLHAYIISLINWNLAWLTFFAFFIQGIAISLEQPILDKFPGITKWPKWVKWILTMLFLDITLGIFGLSFS